MRISKKSSSYMSIKEYAKVSMPRDADLGFVEGKGPNIEIGTSVQILCASKKNLAHNPMYFLILS